ncbi:ribosome maturation factor RimM [Alistipes indistinctus]|uniref:ribosome maturation factor RimM n=1 Tax=Alistipes indistinctus TaxID=626932 RepID=UPI0032C1B4FD
MLEENAEAVARVSKTFGQNGELTLNLYDSFPQDFNPSEPLFVVIDKLAVPLFCDRFQRRGRSGAVVTFGDIDTERRAAELIGLELYLSPGPDEEDDEGDGLIYLEDLVGYTVRLTGENPDTPVSNPLPPSSSPESKPAPEPGPEHSETGSDEQRSGCSADQIEEFIDGENPLFRVRIGSREVLIPAVEEFIADIDQERQSIEFDLPEGLLELYS